MAAGVDGLGARDPLRWLPTAPLAPRSPPPAGSPAAPFGPVVGRPAPGAPLHAGWQPRFLDPAAAPVQVPDRWHRPWAGDAEAVGFIARVEAAEADLAASAVHGAALLEAARTRLEGRGVKVADVVTAEGFPALQILPDPTTGPGTLATFLQRQVDGFKLLYAPKKLLDQATRGSVWGFQREVCAAHGLVVEGRPDPITLHEVEHAVLNLFEERGVAHRWLGFMQSIDGNPISDVHEEQGGYVTYASVQEVPAYAAQVRALGRRLVAAPEPGRDLEEVGAMARWGRALAGRTESVARRALAHLAEHPENAVFELRRNTPAGRDAAGTPEVLWVSVDRPDVRLSFPIFAAEARQAHADMQAAEPGAQGAWEAARDRLLTVLERRLQDLAAAAGAAHGAFDAVVRGAEAAPESRRAILALGRRAAQLTLR